MFNRRTQRRLAALVTIAIAGAGGSLQAAPVGAAQAQAAPVGAAQARGGRVTLQPPVRVIDTRGTTAPRPVHLPSSSVLRINATDSKTPGELYVRPCAASDAPPAVLVFDTNETVTNLAITGPAETCASTPSEVLVDVYGTVADTPFDGGMQYVALTGGTASIAPTVLLPGDTTLSVPSPPATASAVVLDVLTFGMTAGYATFYACGSPRPVVGDIVVTTGITETLVYAPLASIGSASLCVYSQSPTVIAAGVVGYLQTEGPDPTRLPPTMTFGPGLVPPPGLVASAPQRVLDTREPSIATDPDTGEDIEVPAVKITGGVPYALSLSNYVSVDSRAAVLNVTVTEPEGQGYVTVYPCDAPEVPTASNLNYVAGQTVPNLVTVPIATDGTVCFYSKATTHLVGDLTGTFDNNGGSGAHAVTPARLLDTREPNGVPTAGKQPGGRVLTLQVAGRGGVPSDADAVTLNVTVTEPDSDGYVTVYPCDAPEVPTASNLNYVAGQTVPNAVTVALSSSGTVCLFSKSTAHLVADVAMWYGYSELAGYEELVPDRLLDTRDGTGVAKAGKLAAGGVLALQVAGRGGVPATGAEAVVLNVTATEAVGNGYLTVYPCDAPERPTASNLNYVRSQTVPNQVTVKLSATGTVCVYSQAATHVVADVAGYTTAVGEPGIVAMIG